MGGIERSENDKEEDECHWKMYWAAEGTAKKRAKMGGYGVNG